MALSANALATSGLTKYNLTVATGTANDITSGTPFRIMKIVLTPAAALATLVVENGATVAGTAANQLHLQAAASGASAILNLAPNGIRFGTGVSWTVAGTGSVAEIFGILET